MSNNLNYLSQQGVSIWLDDLSRERLETGNLAHLVKERCVVGVTTNPTIFAAALSGGERYDAQLHALAVAGTGVDQAIVELTTNDVRDACDELAETYRQTSGVDGRVSIEVAPTLAFDTDGTLAAVRMLWSKVDRPNLFIKIPATTEGLPAITAALSEGLSVNVTLIFGLGRYDEVMEAYIAGLEKAAERGYRLGDIHSVASSSRASTPRSTPASTRSARPRPPCSRAEPVSPTRGSPTRPTRRRSRTSGSTTYVRRAHTPSARCGRRPGSRTLTTPTPSTSPS